MTSPALWSVEYNDYDTDDENISAAAEQEDCVPRTELEVV